MPNMLNPLAYLGEVAGSLSVLSVHLFSYICCYQLQFSFSSLAEILFPFSDLFFIFVTTESNLLPELSKRNWQS